MRGEPGFDCIFVEKLQLESSAALTNAFAVMLPVAVRLLARRDLARTCQDAPASWDADEERVDALVEEGEVVEREVAGAQLLADGIEVEVEAVDGVELGELARP